jgi:hypothetical protein
MAVCAGILTKHINTLCGQNVEFVDVKPELLRVNGLSAAAVNVVIV